MNNLKDWHKVKFGELAKQKSVRVDNPNESGFDRYVGLEHLDSGQLTVKRWGSTNDVKSAMKLFNKNDILFARRNTYLKRVSVANFDGVCSGDIIVIEQNLDKLVKGFLPILMQFETFENRVIALSAGAFSKRIKWKQLAEEGILIPSKKEQQKIVDLIWAIEENIEKTENLIKINEKLKQGLLNELLTKGIGHKKFKKTEIGEIPEDWELSNLENLTEKITKGTTPTTYGMKFVEKGINFIKVESIDESGNFIKDKFDYIDEDTHESLKRSIIQENDILFSIAGALGRTAIATKDILPANTNQAIAIIRIKDLNKMNYAYLIYFLSSNLVLNFINKVQVKTAQANISLGVLSKLPITIPPINEQNEIVNIAKNIDSNIFYNKKHVFSLISLKKKLTDEILKGKIEV